MKFLKFRHFRSLKLTLGTSLLQNQYSLSGRNQGRALWTRVSIFFLLGGKRWAKGIEKASEERTGEEQTVRDDQKRREQNPRPDKPRPKNAFAA